MGRQESFFLLKILTSYSRYIPYYGEKIVQKIDCMVHELAFVSDITPEAALAKLAYVLAKNEWSHGQKRKEQNTYTPIDPILCWGNYISFLNFTNQRRV